MLIANANAATSSSQCPRLSLQLARAAKMMPSASTTMHLRAQAGVAVQDLNDDGLTRDREERIIAEPFDDRSFQRFAIGTARGVITARVVEPRGVAGRGCWARVVPQSATAEAEPRPR